MIETPVPAGCVRGAGGMFARSRMPRTRLWVNGSPVGALPVVVHGEPADQVDQLRAGPGPLYGAVFDADRQLGARTPGPAPEPRHDLPRATVAHRPAELPPARLTNTKSDRHAAGNPIPLHAVGGIDANEPRVRRHDQLPPALAQRQVLVLLAPHDMHVRTRIRTADDPRVRHQVHVAAMQTERLTDPHPGQRQDRDQQLVAHAPRDRHHREILVQARAPGSLNPERGNRCNGRATIGGRSSNHGIDPPTGSTTS